ncbi:MAG: lipoyl synthase [Euryarchaeota archaeon]|nr:lipoyl synthase [Euryarchaeota archaeon]MDE1881802.1 lipoyl synthase [Euryarchaeota archaeon]
MEGTSRLPPWIRMGLPKELYPQVRDLLQGHHLATVCREARCPNLTECWSAGTATLMLLGDTCTRRCSFCAVTTRSPHGVVDETEPERVADAVSQWGLRYVVLTQVCRDDLADHGARVLAATVRAIHARSRGTRVEVLAGDLGGDPTAIGELLRSGPEVFAHNLETVRRLSPSVRDRRADYELSLRTLKEAKRLEPRARVTKSSLMLGLGETREEVVETMRDLREAGVDLLTLGQYLRPGGRGFHAVERYVPPEEFTELGREAEELGFAGVASGPMVRSSYHADELFVRALARGSV